MDEAGQQYLEETLRRAVLAGDERAWRTLYERSFDRLYAYAFYRCNRHPQRTEDVVQECWTIAVRGIGKFNPEEGCFEQWLFGIAANVLRNHRRRWQRRDTAEVATPHGEHCADNGAATQLHDQIAAAYAAISERHQAVLRAKYEEQRSVAEIAHDWGESAKAVESLLTRARSAFRRAYAELE